MKILFVISSLSHGGAERVLVNIANTLCLKHKVSIATFSNTDSFYPLDEKIQHMCLDLLKPSHTIVETLYNSLRRFFILSRVIETLDPDIIISFMTHTNIIALLAAKWTKRKIIISERITYVFYSSWTLNLIRKLTYPLCDYLITQTHEDAKKYSFVKNVMIIYNPIVVSSDSLSHQKEKIILAVGRLDKQKGFDKLIMAYKLLSSKDDWELWIVGEGCERDALEKQISESNIQNIKLLGIQKNIFDYYAKASIFVLSSEKEGFPNALLEAMSCGCACISFDCPCGPAEIIEHGVNGILVENQNIEQLAEWMQVLMENDSMRQDVSQKALKVTKKYAIESIIQQWEEIIQRVYSK
ncbi:glycosyltransferase family 4 protein [Sulfurospirillum barnesii]|uniref:Glycosyltransferase n=1 Tax=Sulfurospirillum barnesii (strain ATCC 700032 / DSM 10660 / SES-3) TaxID=760154 RepID=I3XYY1_SULBS|nr:glycosyltransferase family 4 protein [Sulfurospirillum barnesii]AFL69155.1 glycosyltransferase [Sulfurospirillum barnesii SES-3]